MIKNHERYFLSLTGAFAGFLSWAFGIWIPVLWTIPQELGYFYEMTDSILISLLIGAFCMALASHQEQGKVKPFGILIGAIGGVIAGLVSSYVFYLISECVGDRLPWLSTILAWFLTGAFIGIVIGIIKYRRHCRRIRSIMLSMLGGSVGATVGGCIFVFSAQYFPYYTHALSLTLTGLGIALCSSEAVDLLHKAKIVYIHDPTNPLDREKLKQHEWFLISNERCLIGNSGDNNNNEKTLFINISDTRISKYHVWIVGSKDGFYFMAHDTNKDPNGQPMDVKVSQHGSFVDVCNGDPIEHNMIIKVGQTKLKFLGKGKKND